MSWAEIKKAVNSDLSTPLNTLVTALSEEIKSTFNANGHRIFTSNGTFTVPENVYKVYVTMADGGGGGGSCMYYSRSLYSAKGGNGGGLGGSGGQIKNKNDDTNPADYAAGTYFVTGAGGGAGGVLLNYPLSVLPNQVYNIQVGAGGAGGYYVSATPWHSSLYGKDGGESKVIYDNNVVVSTTLCGGIRGKNGGSGVVCNYSGMWGASGAGGGIAGNGTSGYMNSNNTTSTTDVLGGDGISLGVSTVDIGVYDNTFGRGADGLITSFTDGKNGFCYGGGGSGSMCGSSSAHPRGGNGAQGIVIITWGYLANMFLNTNASS